MSIHKTLITCSTALTVAAAEGALAQRGAPPPRGAAQRPDSVKRTVALDFQDQELRTVLDAIAAAGELNVALTNIPSTRVTVHMGRPVDREQMIEVLKQVAEANNLKVTLSPAMIQISGPPPDNNRLTPAQQIAQTLAQQAQAQQIRLFTYRLRHASAVQLAPVLTNLFSGATTVFRGPNVAGGVAIGVTPPTNAVPPGNITTIPNPLPPTPSGAGRGGFNPGGGGRGNQGQVATIQNAIAAAGGLSGQSGDIRIIAEESSNSLLVRATEGDWALIQQIIQGVDLRPLQVLIEVTIAEVQRTKDFDLGVSGNVTATRRNGGTDTLGIPSANSARDFIVRLTGGNGSVRYDVALAALQERGDVRVLSLPVIIAQNNRQAVLNVGSSRPFVQITQTVPNDPTGRVQTIQYIDVGTTLTITPTINPDGYVNLQVAQTDNSATNQVQFDAPVINKREATTQIFIRDGQTTVIGGLADNTNSSDVSGIPLLSKIPVLGTLIFGRTTKSQATNELFLFLTPHIISSDEDIDKLRNGVKQGSDLLKDVQVGPRIKPTPDTINIRIPPDTLPAGGRPPEHRR